MTPLEQALAYVKKKKVVSCAEIDRLFPIPRITTSTNLWRCYSDKVRIIGLYLAYIESWKGNDYDLLNGRQAQVVMEKLLAMKGGEK